MLTLNVHEAKTQLSSVLDRVEKGEVVQLARRNRVVAEIRPLIGRSTRPARQLDAPEPGFTVPDSFFDPLPDDLMRRMLGED